MSHEKKSIAVGVVINDRGQILAYTTESSISKCEEMAVERWGQEQWDRMKELGAQVKQGELFLVE